jgi:hypothetical protein
VAYSLGIGKRKGLEMATLRELAVEMNLSDGLEDRGGGMVFLNIDNRLAVVEDEKELHLTDLLSWARFAPVKIGRKSNVTRKGLEFQFAQAARYRKQIGA